MELLSSLWLMLLFLEVRHSCDFIKMTGGLVILLLYNWTFIKAKVEIFEKLLVIIGVSHSSCVWFYKFWHTYYKIFVVWTSCRLYAISNDRSSKGLTQLWLVIQFGIHYTFVVTSKDRTFFTTWILSHRQGFCSRLGSIADTLIGVAFCNCRFCIGPLVQ